MATTYNLINSSVLSSSTSSVTFSSIPATYTDLVLKTSTRMDSGNTTAPYQVRFNGVSTGSAYSNTGAYYSASVATGFALANDNGVRSGANNTSGTGATADSFGFGEFYIPNYAGASNKQIEHSTASENNGVTNLGQGASQFRNTSAITSITIVGTNDNFVSGSSFYLYGISNA